jgi:hypothetical protein
MILLLKIKDLFICRYRVTKYIEDRSEIEDAKRVPPLTRGTTVPHHL